MSENAERKGKEGKKGKYKDFFLEYIEKKQILKIKDEINAQVYIIFDQA